MKTAATPDSESQTRFARPMASSLWLLALEAVGAICLLVSSPVRADSGADNPPIAIHELCSGASRLTALDLSLADGGLSVAPICVADGRGQTAQSKPVRFAVQAPTEVPGSVYSIATTERFNIDSRIEADSQITTITHRDGRHCLTISASARVKSPVPARFLPASRDWRQTIDHMIDANCSLLIVRVGNKVAAVSASRSARFDLYDLRVTTR